KPRHHLVQVREARRHSGDQLFARVKLFDRVEARLSQITQRDKTIANAILRDRKDRVLRLIEDHLGILFRLVRRGQNLVRIKDQVPESRLFLDDAGVLRNVGRARHAVDERGDVRGAAHFFDFARAPELFFQGHEIDRLAPLGERHHLVEDAAVSVAEEVARVDDLRSEIKGVVVQQDGAENRPLRFEIVGKRPFGGDGLGHGTGEPKTENSEVKRSSSRHSTSGTTLTFTLAVTSRWSLMGTSTSLIFLIGSPSCTFRRSMSNPFAASTATTSTAVTDPYSASVSPTFLAISTSTSASRAARPCAAVRSSAS